MKFPIIRPKLFSLAIAALTTSGAVLVGGYVRHVQATDYLKQGAEGVPWVQWGTATAVTGFLLSFFGKPLSRITCVIVASLLVVYWYLVAASLF